MSDHQKQSAILSTLLVIVLAAVLWFVLSTLQQPQNPQNPAQPPLANPVDPANPGPQVNPADPAPNFTAPEQAAAAIGTKQPDGTLFFGWTPNPQSTQAFLATLNKPFLSQAGPELIQKYQDQKPVLLYRSLYKAYAATHGGEQWRVGRQGIGDCFIGGTMVAMADGTEKAIEKVRVGEYVLSHTGKPQRVIDTFVKSYTGELVTITAKGWDVPITATADHQFAHYPGIRFGKGSGNFKPDATPRWTAIGDLSVGQRVLLTKPQYQEVEQSLLIDGKPIAIDTDFGYLVGLFLAEGGYSKYPNGLANRLDFSLGRHESFLINHAAAIIKRVFGWDATIDNLPSKPSVTMLRCGCVAVAQAFQEIIRGNVYTKEVPTVIFNSPQAVRIAVLRGWMDGDGHRKINKSRGGSSFQIQGVSASIPLLKSMHRLAASCGIKSSLRLRAARPDRHESGDLFFYGKNALAIYPEWTDRINTECHARGVQQTHRDEVTDGVAAPITSIERRNVINEPVHCITVENEHSFIANGYGVHNCVSWGWAHGVDIHLAVLWELGEVTDWRPAATESIYGGSRVEARGVTRGGWSDGSYGSAAAKWVKNWGIVHRQPYEGLVDLSKYDSSRAKDWGNYGNGGRDDNSKLDEIAKKYPVKGVALARSFKEAAAAIQSGYPVPVCSMRGFSSQRDKDGFCPPRGSWAHCMCFIAVRFDRPGLLCLNSWGPNAQSGPKWPDDMPDGSFWVDADVVDKMLAGGDSFAVSGYEGFPHKNLTHGDWVQVAPPVNHFHARRQVELASNPLQLAP